MEPTIQNSPNEASKTVWMTIISIVVLALLVWGGVYMYNNRSVETGESANATSTATTTKRDLGEDDRVVTVTERAAVESYLKDKIGNLSYRKPAAGRTFTITSTAIEAAGRAIVEYTDGITSRAAAVRYSVDKDGVVSVNTFDILEK